MDIHAKHARTRWALGLLIVLNLATLAALWWTAVRRPPFGGPPRQGQARPEDPQAYLKRELGLSEDQAKSFAAMRDRFVAAARPVHEEIAALKGKALEEMFKPSPDKAVLESVAARVGVLRGEEEKLLSLHFLEMMEACRPDQRAKFQSVLREFMSRIGALEPAGPPDRRNGPPERRDGPPRSGPDEPPPDGRR